ncbi:acetylornithine transaminase [Lactiplantibacillus sp. WILCCON 0030]|uniref:Acetylornithine aminotransferase n=1 Tax=Lactiplantibacillus brownii TaxID=3069269 RepID=A0ABU1A6B7_9LACO|nr:acetylornithine transaminase [Lactiplantibacillus brownii]MDQ7936436.1 acetylornithine transaminase [Lactiplantibacillus brownii]
MKYVYPTYQRFPFEIKTGQGSHLTDNHGKTYLDFTAGIGVCNFGVHQPAIQAAVAEQLTQIWHTSNLYESSLQDTVAKLLVHGEDRLVFFANSGTEANEAALKLARKYTGKTKILAFNQSFHGRTYGSMSMTGNPSIRAGYAPLVPDVAFANYNDDAALAQITPDLAAVILEVVQGEGGVFAGKPAWLQAVQAKCQAQGVLFMIDEVQTGIGRTGYRFAYEGAGLDPDIYTVAKGLANGLPVGAMVGRAKFATAFGPGSHGSTFAGNPLAMAAAQAVLTQLTPAFLTHVRAKSQQVWAAVTQQIAGLPMVKQVTGKGLMIGIHLTTEVPVIKVMTALQQAGLLTLSAGDNTLRLLPPLVMPVEELLQGIQTIATVLPQVETEVEV